MCFLNMENTCDGRLKLCIIMGTMSFTDAQTLYSFCVKNMLTVTIPGQPLNVEAGNKGRWGGGGGEKKGRFRIQRNNSRWLQMCLTALCNKLLLPVSN